MFLRGNQAPFITNEYRKAIYNRSRLRNKFCNVPTEENEKLFKKQRNKCVSIPKKCIRNHFNKIATGNIVTNRNFWKIIKPFLSNKGHLENAEIMLNHNNIICNSHELVKVFNEHCINQPRSHNDKQAVNVI